MSLVYEDWKAPTFMRSKVPISEWSMPRVMGMWKFHAGNRAFLEFMAKAGTFEERARARHELIICARKMTFWERHPEWNKKEAEQELAKIGRQWNGVPPTKE